jgi:hypothetical protein
MGPRERFIKAILCEKPDQIPMFVFGINGVLLEKLLNRPVLQRNPHAYLEMCAKGKIEEAHLKIAGEHIELAEKFDLDAVREVNQLGGWILDPRWEYLPKDSRVVKKSDRQWNINGYEIQYLSKINTLYNPVSYLPTDPDKAKEFLNSHWDDLKIPDQETVTLKEITKHLKGRRFIIGVVQGTFLPFFSPSTHMMEWIHRYPDLIKLWLEYYLRINIERAKAKIDAGADAIIENDDYATASGPMISPKYFKEFVVPNLKRLCNAVHKKGAFFIKHTDGNINLILDDIISTGIDGLHPLEKQAGMDIGKVKEDYKICVLGNVHGALGGSREPDYVIKETVDCIKSAGSKGGYVMTTSNVITSDAQERNFLAWLETTRKYGKYPINLSL